MATKIMTEDGIVKILSPGSKRAKNELKLCLPLPKAAINAAAVAANAPLTGLTFFGGADGVGSGAPAKPHTLDSQGVQVGSQTLAVRRQRLGVGVVAHQEENVGRARHGQPPGMRL